MPNSWHATERYLIRVVGHPRRAGDTFFPLFSGNQGKTLSKYLLIQAFRKTLQAAGISTQVQDAQGKLQDLFGGHCLRVTGAQFLACAGVETPLIQLLAVERYVQSAPLNIIPQIPSRILSEGGGNMGTTRSPGLSAQAPGTPVVAQAPQIIRDRVIEHRYISDPTESTDISREVEILQAEVRQLQTSIQRPSENLVIRPRSSVVHLGMSEEVQNEPRLWRTKCGWQYGLSRFFRVAVLSETRRKCRKRFGTNTADTRDSSEELESSSSSSSSQSSEPSN